MERILWLYALPYDPRYPVICYDERPCFLIGEEIDPLPLPQRAHPKGALRLREEWVVLTAGSD